MKFNTYDDFKDFCINSLNIPENKMILRHYDNEKCGVWFEKEKMSDFSFELRVKFFNKSMNFDCWFKAEFDFNQYFDTLDYETVELQLWNQSDMQEFFIEHFEKFEYDKP